MSDFIKSEVVEGDWERGFAAANAQFQQARDAIIAEQLRLETENEWLRVERRELLSIAKGLACYADGHELREPGRSELQELKNALAGKGDG